MSNQLDLKDAPQFWNRSWSHQLPKLMNSNWIKRVYQLRFFSHLNREESWNSNCRERNSKLTWQIFRNSIMSQSIVRALTKMFSIILWNCSWLPYLVWCLELHSHLCFMHPKADLLYRVTITWPIFREWRVIVHSWDSYYFSFYK